MTSQRKRKLDAEMLRNLLTYDPLTGVFVHLTPTSNRIKVGDAAGSLCDTGYILIGVNGRNYKAHRLAWLYMTGEWPECEIDHRNQTKTDNRWSNLRKATHKENSENRFATKRSATGIRGVSWDARCKKWAAHIMHNYKCIWLGRFDKIEDAASARRRAERKYFTYSNA